MSILIVAATEAEVKSLRETCGQQVDFLITGVGIAATAFSLGAYLAAHRCDLAINLGIAGSFDRGIELGNLVEIREDTLAELGAEDGEEFIPLPVLGFGESTFTPTTTLRELPGHFSLPQAKAITVNTVHGHDASIQKIQARLAPQIESMEGAAFFYACHKMAVPCLQIRAVSNYVEKRNRDSWQMAPALNHLNQFAIELVENLVPQKS